MNKSSYTLFYFSIYLLVTGLILLLSPNTLLGLFGLPHTEEIWIKVVGMLVLFLGFYYQDAARNNYLSFKRLSVKLRWMVLFFFCVFASLKWVDPMLIAFGVIDVAGALWTHNELRKERLAEINP